MKLIACLILLSVSNVTSARNDRDFNKILLQNVDKEIKKDAETFRTKDIVRTRGPASVQEHQIEEESKVDKKDRQIGPKSW